MQQDQQAPMLAHQASSYHQALMQALITAAGERIGLHPAAVGDALSRAPHFDLAVDGKMRTASSQTVDDFLIALRWNPDASHLFSRGADTPKAPVPSRRMRPHARLEAANKAAGGQSQ